MSAGGQTGPSVIPARDNPTMETLTTLFGLVLHVDVYLRDLVLSYGIWIYALLFAVIFVETGLVVMPLLPGDSLLFVAGALAGVGLLSYPLLLVVLIIAAVLGNQTNYAIGRQVGERVFHWEQSRWFNRAAFDRAHSFYERYGGVTLILGRFMPFVRTFAPFVAGVAMMTRRRFTFFDVVGGSLWVGSLVSAGYFFGNLPWVSQNLGAIVWIMILIPGAIILIGALKSRQTPIP
jgi:membrane-associated protein